MSQPEPSLIRRFLEGLIALLPAGPAWEGFRTPGAWGFRLLEAKAEGWAQVDVRAVELSREANPLYVQEMLASREREAGLPDTCLPSDLTEAERRLHLLARWRQWGGQDVYYFASLADTLDYPVTIEEPRPFRCGYSHCGADHQLGDPLMRHHWYVRVHEPRLNYFRCGQSMCGRDPLGFVRRADDLECVLRRVRPAHMVLHFIYEGV